MPAQIGPPPPAPEPGLTAYAAAVKAGVALDEVHELVATMPTDQAGIKRVALLEIFEGWRQLAEVMGQYPGAFRPPAPPDDNRR